MQLYSASAEGPGKGSVLSPVHMSPTFSFLYSGRELILGVTSRSLKANGAEAED